MRTTKEYTDRPIKQDNVPYFPAWICAGSENGAQSHLEWELEEFVAGE